MWVVPRFDGDVDMEVANKQHDVYGQALWIIVRQCNLYAEFARRVLDDADHSEWGTVESFDHRTLQGAHDLLAAATSRTAQKKLPPGSPTRRFQRFGGPSEYLGDAPRAAVAAQGTSLGPFCRPSRSISRSVSKVRW